MSGGLPTVNTLHEAVQWSANGSNADGSSTCSDSPGAAAKSTPVEQPVSAHHPTQHLATTLSTWLSESMQPNDKSTKSRVFLVLGEPSIGKAFALNMIATAKGVNPPSARYTFTRAPETRHMGEFCRSIASQLAETVPGYIDIIKECNAAQKALLKPSNADHFINGIFAPLWRLRLKSTVWLQLNALDEALLASPTDTMPIAWMLGTPFVMGSWPPCLRIVATARQSAVSSFAWTHESLTTYVPDKDWLRANDTVIRGQFKSHFKDQLDTNALNALVTVAAGRFDIAETLCANLFTELKTKDVETVRRVATTIASAAPCTRLRTVHSDTKKQKLKVALIEQLAFNMNTIQSGSKGLSEVQLVKILKLDNQLDMSKDTSEDTSKDTSKDTSQDLWCVSDLLQSEAVFQYTKPDETQTSFVRWKVSSDYVNMATYLPPDDPNAIDLTRAFSRASMAELSVEAARAMGNISHPRHIHFVCAPLEKQQSMCDALAQILRRDMKAFVTGDSLMLRRSLPQYDQRVLEHENIRNILPRALPHTNSHHTVLPHKHPRQLFVCLPGCPYAGRPSRATEKRYNLGVREDRKQFVERLLSMSSEAPSLSIKDIQDLRTLAAGFIIDSVLIEQKYRDLAIDIAKLEVEIYKLNAQKNPSICDDPVGWFWSLVGFIDGTVVDQQIRKKTAAAQDKRKIHANNSFFLKTDIALDRVIQIDQMLCKIQFCLDFRVGSRKLSTFQVYYGKHFAFETNTLSHALASANQLEQYASRILRSVAIANDANDTE